MLVPIAHHPAIPFHTKSASKQWQDQLSCIVTDKQTADDPMHVVCVTSFVAGCVPTISDTAAALSAPRAAVVKTMALLVEQEPLLVVTRGDQRVDMHKARSSAADSGMACSIAHSTRVCRYAAHAELARRVQSAALCAPRSMSDSLQEVYHPLAAHRVSGCRNTASSSSNSRIVPDLAVGRRHVRGGVCLARYAPPAAAAAARRLWLLCMV
jgi:hypothetical protein